MLEAPDWAPHGESVLYQLDRKILENSKKSHEPIIIGLAIAVIIGIGIVCLRDAPKNKLK